MASVLLALWEFLAAANTKRRDAFLYRLQVSNKYGKADATVSAVMSNRRNALMRTRCAHNETVLEICFSVTALILIVANKVSLDGKGLPPIGSLLQNFGVQWTTEVIVDLAIIMWLTVMAQQPVLAVSHKLFRVHDVHDRHLRLLRQRLLPL